MSFEEQSLELLRWGQGRIWGKENEQVAIFIAPYSLLSQDEHRLDGINKNIIWIYFMDLS